MNEGTSILFLGKRDDYYCERAVEFTCLAFPQVEVILGRRGECLPDNALGWSGDYIVSYLSPWIVPGRLLERPSKASINFHPGSPEYPGIGCTNQAIYVGAEVFGVTCHYMAESVDSGEIIYVKRFPLIKEDTVYSLTQRCYGFILAMFYEIMLLIHAGEELPRSEEVWERKPFTRRELNELCRITPDMPVEEIRRRVRAVTFPDAPGAFVELEGVRFVLDSPKET